MTLKIRIHPDATDKQCSDAAYLSGYSGRVEFIEEERLIKKSSYVHWVLDMALSGWKKLINLTN